MLRFCRFLAVVTIALVMLPCGLYALTDIIPPPGAVLDFNPGGKPQVVEGEDLFLLINGGAEIYQEYGFKRALAEEYKNPGGKTVNLEVFEMDDPAASFGVYTFKIGGKGKPLPIGHGAMLEDYYLNFWKGRYLVTLTGFDSEQETLEGLTALAKWIADRIEATKELPALVELLPKKNLREAVVKYMLGPLALFNQYDFSPEDIFGIQEGVLGDYGDFKVFVFQYDTPAQTLHWFKTAAAHLESSSRYRNFSRLKTGITLEDEKGRPIFLRMNGRYILVLLDKPAGQAAAFCQKMTAPWPK